MCTTTKYGFTDADFLDFITWKKAVHQPVQKLALVFREKNALVEGVPVTQPAVIAEVIINHIGKVFQKWALPNLFLEHDGGSFHHWGGTNAADDSVTFTNLAGNENIEMEMFDNDASTSWQSSLGRFSN